LEIVASNISQAKAITSKLVREYDDDDEIITYFMNFWIQDESHFSFATAKLVEQNSDEAVPEELKRWDVTLADMVHW
jgi:hypothetical protein